MICSQGVVNLRDLSPPGVLSHSSRWPVLPFLSVEQPLSMACAEGMQQLASAQSLS